jgi:dTDP-4-dehydrorhamnose 3,5-epimerase
MMFTPLALPDIILIEPRRHVDERGWFVETWKASSYRAGGILSDFVQDNESMSRATGTLRGLHFQAPPSAQAKLVRCTAGAVYDVAVDIRRSSPTFGHHIGIELSAANGWQIYIPEGFAHGYLTLAPDTVIEYKVSRLYEPAADCGLAWNDPKLGISWPLAGRDPILSPRDRQHPPLHGLANYF